LSEASSLQLHNDDWSNVVLSVQGVLHAEIDEAISTSISIFFIIAFLFRHSFFQIK